MFKKKKDEFIGMNLLDLRPIRAFEFEVQGDGKVTVLIPKFRGKILGKYLQPYLKKKYFRVKLDTFGSFVWTHCDGKLRVGEIAERFKKEFSTNIEQSDERVAKFIQKLYHSDCVFLSR